MAPLPSALFSAHIFPPCASIILFETNSPRPVPSNDFVANLVNSLGNISESIPVPVSFILNVTLPSFLSKTMDIVPSLVNFTALLSRLEIIWVILSLSASIKSKSSF